MMRVRIAKERSDLTDLVSAAIKRSYHTRSPGGVERCNDVLSQLKSLPLSAKDIRCSESIVKIENLRRHRNPNIRKEAQDLFDSWAMTLYAQGRHNTGLTKLRLKPKNPVQLRRRSELKTIEEMRSHEAVEIKKKTDFLGLRKKDDKKSSTREAQGHNKKTSFLELNKREYETCEIEEIKLKETKTGFWVLKKKEDDKTCDLKKETKTELNLKRRGDACEAVITKKQRVDVKVTALKTTKTEAELEKKLMELFESAKKAADVANNKGILSGKADASRCVKALSLLMRMNMAPKPKEPRRMMERLERLTKHKDRQICNAASALLQLWRQRIKELERKESGRQAFTRDYNVRRHG